MIPYQHLNLVVFTLQNKENNNKLKDMEPQELVVYTLQNKENNNIKSKLYKIFCVVFTLQIIIHELL